MKINHITGTLITSALILMLSNCSKQDDDQFQPVTKSESHLKAAMAWTNVFTDNFDNTGSWNNWTRTERFDYNSDYCEYLASDPQIATYDNKSCLVLTAVKNGSIWNSGHVKSNISFKPGINEEYRTSAYIKLMAVNGGVNTDFASTYGVWPAFWTVQETNWPVNGEIDIFEGYSYGTYARFASNLFYGKRSGRDQLRQSCERPFDVTEGWHLYEEYWTNVNGVVTITIQLDGVTVASYANDASRFLELENFGPHNIILNLNVGDNYRIFDSKQINVFDKTMMWVDYVTVDKRTL